MGTAVTARQQGDDYQAYHFWMLAAEMLRPTARIAEVGYEVGDYKSFDDVAVKYAQPRIHAHGIEIDADYFQIKFSVNRSWWPYFSGLRLIYGHATFRVSLAILMPALKP